MGRTQDASVHHNHDGIKFGNEQPRSSGIKARRADMIVTKEDRQTPKVWSHILLHAPSGSENPEILKSCESRFRHLQSPDSMVLNSAPVQNAICSSLIGIICGT